ncbi:DNA-directed RNA polymerase subunit delta [Virgibacillus ainsalahensis]
MSLKEYSHEELKSMPMLELTSAILWNEKKAMNFHDLFSKVAEHKDYSDADKEANIAQFYTDMNVDGRFMTVGSNLWGLKRWYPVEQMDEEVADAPKKKKKKKAAPKKKKELPPEEEELDIVDEDIEEMVDDYEEVKELGEEEEEPDAELDEEEVLDDEKNK